MPVAKDREMKGSVLTPAEADDLFFPKITQAGHGWSILTVVRRSGASTWAAAQADSPSNIGFDIAVVVHVIDANTVKVARMYNTHEISAPSHGLGPTLGTNLYLSESTAGLLTDVEPPPGQRVRLGYVVDANTVVIRPTTLIEAENDVMLLRERAEPPNPADGDILVWRSDGTGGYNAGDVVITSRAGATTKHFRIVDFTVG